ncbi:glutathione S-transferase [Aaosphaeria arxii CBS 175.79]|uniref:Glutathione S-transferase n=1 Tax=Aaosphaeria arxii CBS 175.79 TaxID=1450172 RepID=A0A6A5Y0M4_9PLEO|nr:glutathione S-transferase [Aaosphaeria arxii CBS 175.79]KAF2018481.1 glutathione S-transferase [Aaosphaeria arxii CBS 175.79]
MPPTTSHPDADLHPTASGLAQATVEAHSAAAPHAGVTLYSGWFCPFVQRVWIALEEKRIPYQYVEVNPYDKPPSLLSLNPRGLVPTLEYDGKPLYESNVLLQFLEDAFPDHGPRLLPEDPYDRARSRIWADFVTSRVIPSFHRFLQDTEGGEALEGKRREFLGFLKEFAAELHHEGPFWGGEELGFVDVVLGPWGIRLWVFDHFKGGLGIPGEGEGGEDEEVWGRFRKWLRAIEERKSVKETTSEQEFYLPIYQRYADDKAQSELAKATRAGRGVP